MIKVYFEYSTHAQIVAIFETEEMYAVCFPSLEQEAKNLGVEITESVENKYNLNDIGAIATSIEEGLFNLGYISSGLFHREDFEMELNELIKERNLLDINRDLVIDAAMLTMQENFDATHGHTWDSVRYALVMELNLDEDYN